MTTLGFYGSNRRSSGSSSRTSTLPTSAENDGVINAKVDQLLSLVEKLQRDQRQLHQSIVTLTERVDCLCESTERLQAIQASESSSKRGQKKLPTILSVSLLKKVYIFSTCVFVLKSLYCITSEHCKDPAQ